MRIEGIKIEYLLHCNEVAYLYTFWDFNLHGHQSKNLWKEAACSSFLKPKSVHAKSNSRSLVKEDKKLLLHFVRRARVVYTE